MPKKTIFRWTPVYDDALRQIKSSYEHLSWPDTAERVGLLLRQLRDNSIQRFPSGRQCRDRWIENLDPTLSRDPLTRLERVFVFNMKKLGYGYAEIARDLNHPPNQIKCAYISKKRRRVYKLRSAEASPGNQGSIPDDVPEPLTNNGVDCSNSDSDLNVPLPTFSSPAEDHRFFAKPPIAAEPPSIEPDPDYSYSDLGELAQEIIEQTQFNKYYSN